MADDDHNRPHIHHKHPHGGASGGEDYAARTHPEFVALDIGDDVGALIVHTDPELHGIEIEISAAGDDHRRTHKQVLECTLNQAPAFTAVFDGLSAGRYTLWIEDRPRASGVLVEGSSIAELDWRAAPSR